MKLFRANLFVKNAMKLPIVVDIISQPLILHGNVSHVSMFLQCPYLKNGGTDE